MHCFPASIVHFSGLNLACKQLLYQMHLVCNVILITCVTQNVFILNHSVPKFIVSEKNKIRNNAVHCDLLCCLPEHTYGAC